VDPWTNRGRLDHLRFDRISPVWARWTLPFSIFFLDDCAHVEHCAPIRVRNNKTPRANTRRGLKNPEHETGLEPATPTLARAEEDEDER